MNIEMNDINTLGVSSGMYQVRPLTAGEAGLEQLNAPDLQIRDAGSTNLHLNRAMP